MADRRENKNKGVKVGMYEKERQGMEGRWCWEKGHVCCVHCVGSHPTLDSDTRGSSSLNCSPFS